MKIEKVKRWCHNHLFSFLPEPIEDDVCTIVHQTLSLCPHCGRLGQLRKIPLGRVQEFKLFQVRFYATYRYTCFSCDWDSKTFKEIAKPRKRRKSKWVKYLKSLIQSKNE